MEFNNLIRQQSLIKSGLQNRIGKVLRHGQYIMGPEVFELENKLKEFTKSKYCITTSSGTDALLISLMCLGISKGDEVITSPFTFVSSIEVIVRLGAKPIFVDIEADTCNINANLIQRKITKKTKAILVVSLFGQTADISKINSIAKEHGKIPVIEDAAQSFGASYKNKRSCNLTTIGCTSFFPSKPLGCYGDGGAIFTNNKKLANICKQIRVHGQSKKYVYTRLGIGGRMDTLQCAILLEKLKLFESEIIMRQEAAIYYNNFFKELNIRYIEIKNNRTSVYAQYCIFVKNRKKMVSLMNDNNIPHAIYYPKPLNEQKAFSVYNNDKTPISSLIANEIISIPFSPYITRSEQNKVLSLISDNFR